MRSGGGLTSSQTADAQAGYESLMTMLPTFLAGINWVMHSAGWLEGGLVASYEKFVLDVQVLEMLQQEFTPLEIDEASLAFGAHDEVRHGGHFLGAAHTMERFRTCFYRPFVNSSDNYDRWMRNGAKDAAARARDVATQEARRVRAPAARRRGARGAGRVRDPPPPRAGRLEEDDHGCIRCCSKHRCGPATARVVVIGAGIVGNSLVHHLARLGWRDIVQIDKGALPNPGGSTGHASNFIFPVDHSREITDLTLDSMRQYKELGVFTESGGYEVARTEERMEELRRRMSSAKAWGIAAELVTPDHVVERVPFLDKDKILGAFWCPSVGVVDSLRAGTLMRESALALGALTVVPTVEVVGMDVEQGRIRRVRTSGGDIEAETVVIACGVWSPKLAQDGGRVDPAHPRRAPDDLGGPDPAARRAAGRDLVPDHPRHGHLLLRAPARRRHGGRLLRPPRDPLGARGHPVDRAEQALPHRAAVHGRRLRPAAGAGVRADAGRARAPTGPRSATRSTGCSR